MKLVSVPNIWRHLRMGTSLISCLHYNVDPFLNGHRSTVDTCPRWATLQRELIKTLKTGACVSETTPVERNYKENKKKEKTSPRLESGSKG